MDRGIRNEDKEDISGSGRGMHVFCLFVFPPFFLLLLFIIVICYGKQQQQQQQQHMSVACDLGCGVGCGGGDGGGERNVRARVSNTAIDQVKCVGALSSPPLPPHYPHPHLFLLTSLSLAIASAITL